MSDIDVEVSELGRIRVFGHLKPNSTTEALWELNGYTPRIPKDAGSTTKDDTPGVFGLRTLVLRYDSRRMWFEFSDGSETTARFTDPLLMDLFLKSKEKDESKFNLVIFGVNITGSLSREARAQVSPLWEHPDIRTPGNKKILENIVPAYLLQTGSLQLDAKTLNGLKFPDLDDSQPIELMPHGIMFSAKVPPPDGSTTISTRLRMTYVKGEVRLEFVNPQPPAAQTAWRIVWKNLNDIAVAARDTAWLRLAFFFEADLPVLSWRVERKDKKLTINWSKFDIPEGVAQITLSDQPLESQVLAPLQVMQFTRKVTFKRTKDALEVSASPNVEHKQKAAEYKWDGKKETLSFQAMPLVHDALAVRRRLFNAYGLKDSARELTMDPAIGFMKLEDGWAEIPFDTCEKLNGGGSTLPEVIQPHNARDVMGSLWIGTRRPEFHGNSVSSSCAPWSIQVDEPDDYSFSLNFKLPADAVDGTRTKASLSAAKIVLENFAFAARGMTWLAASAPDGHDALPVVSDDPDAFFDILLRKCAGKTLDSPFVFNQFCITAQSNPNGDWDRPSELGTREPKVELQLSVNLKVTAPSKEMQRIWLRHERLPSVQVLAATRSDTSSNRPHASRALTPFDAVSSALELDSPLSMSPMLEKETRNKFKAVVAGWKGWDGTPAEAAMVPLVALTLPGVEIEAKSPSDYRAKGSYTLPLWEDTHARATVPPPEDAPKQTVIPEVTALNPAALARLMRDNINLRLNASTQQSQMFTSTSMKVRVQVEAQCLYPPFHWNAHITIDDAMVIDQSNVIYGNVSFQDGAWEWSKSGDDLLQGPTGVLRLTGRSCSLLASGEKDDPMLVGWSVAEQENTENNIHLIRDGRGFEWIKPRVLESGLIERQVQVQGEKDDAIVFSLLSTDRPIAVGGLPNVAWEISFTDVPIFNGKLDLSAQFGVAMKAWTWSLSEPAHSQDDLAIAPLLLGPCLRFVPTALKEIVWQGGNNPITKVVIEGSLVLGADNRAVTADTLRRVSITMTATLQGEMGITSIDTFDRNPILWDLDLESTAGIFSGAPKLEAKLKVEQGQLWLREPRLFVRIFEADFDIRLNDVKSTDRKMTFRDTNNGIQKGLVQVTQAAVDLVGATLLMVEMHVVLRESVSCLITHKRGATLARLNWFGNAIEWDAEIDSTRHSFVFNRKEDGGQAVEIFPGKKAARFKDGIVCLSFELSRLSKLVVKTHFLELVLQDEGFLITHQMHSDTSTNRDTLRFDGTWKQKSLVKWPKPNRVNFDFTGDDQEIDFNDVQNVEHEASFILSDHCLEGTSFECASTGRGICMGDAVSSQASTWLVDTIHRFNVSEGASSEVQSLCQLQFWRPKALSVALKANWEKQGSEEGFSFVPGYLGNIPHTNAFLRPGVRRVDHGFAGLFDTRIVDALLKENENTWIMLGSTTALCRDEVETSNDVAIATFLLLHLPFFGALGNGEALAPLLTVTGKNRKLTMSRHDIVNEKIYANAAQAQTLGELVTHPLHRKLPFTLDLRIADSLGGAVIARNWFAERKTPIVAGWHMEQLQRPGKTPKSGANPDPLPFAYPRAALMLTALLDSLSKSMRTSRETLSLLTGIDKRAISDNAQPMMVEFRTIRLQPYVARALVEPETDIASSRSDLIVGGPHGVVAIPLTEADASVSDDRRLIALAIAGIAQPTFVVHRRINHDVSNYRNCQLPALDRDPLEFQVRALRSNSNLPSDGRLTWPSPPGVNKSTTDVRAHVRAPRQYAAPLAMAGIAGCIDTSLLMGKPFTLDTTLRNRGKTETVWVQEWEHVSYAFTPDTHEDAAPWMRDATAPARPLVPSACEIASALRRIDPALSTVRRIQTWLPMTTASIDFSSRAGAFVAMGVRGMRSVNVKHRQFEPADPGPATVRTIRRPRPVALPQNGDDVQTWRRTVAWYGQKDQTCLALAGVWDSITAPLVNHEGIMKSEVPQWCLFMGNPQPFGLVTESRGSAPSWRGSVMVQCLILNNKGEPIPEPAYVVLQMLFAAQNDNSLRCGLRVDSRVIDVTQVAIFTDKNGRISDDKLVFSLGGGERITPSYCTLECSFIPQQAILKKRVDPVVIAALAKVPEKLDSTAQRTISLLVRGPKQDRYPLPILRRTVFFADPAFDRELSQIDPVSVNEPFDGNVPKEVFSAWIDRPSVTPDEMAVVRLKTNWPHGPANAKTPPSYKLCAKVRRRDGGSVEDLLFYLARGVTALDSVSLELNEFYALPTSSLRSRIGDALNSGDTLVLEVVCMIGKDTIATARLMVPVKLRSNLPPPQSMYSLVVSDLSRKAAWCAAHSPLPAPESMWTEVLNADTDKLIRRGVFKWVTYDRISDEPLAYSILKAEKATESTHIPQKLEFEMKLS